MGNMGWIWPGRMDKTARTEKTCKAGAEIPRNH